MKKQNTTTPVKESLEDYLKRNPYKLTSSFTEDDWNSSMWEKWNEENNHPNPTTPVKDEGYTKNEILWEVYDHPNGNFQVVKKFIGAIGILCEVEVFPYSDKEQCRQIAQNIADQSNRYPKLKADNERLLAEIERLKLLIP